MIQVFETHFWWSDEEEDNEGKELDERYWLLMGAKRTKIHWSVKNEIFNALVEKRQIFSYQRVLFLIMS